MINNLAQMYYQTYPTHRMMDDGHSWFIPGMLLLILIIILIVVLIYKGRGSDPVNPRDPIDLAKERFAKGEIGKDEFVEIKKMLKSKD